jgi:vacuolar-type H+-ATPase catalytic subunit A/Vma1
MCWIIYVYIYVYIYNIFKSPDTVTVIKVGRLELFGHVVRMDGERTVTKLLEGGWR